MTTKKETAFLNKHVFYDLTDLNTGFDIPIIKYFTEAQFEIVLKRIEKLGCGVHGIEPWWKNQYFDVRTCPRNEEYTPSTWFWKVFNDFKARAKKEGVELDYSATYFIPPELLNA
jgi:hypothetical protein